MMGLNSLPDHVLFEVMSYLDEEELLDCRRVCRRWRALALLPILWQDRCIHFFTSTEFIATAFRLIPRLHSLRMNLANHGEACDVLLATPTAIEDVTLVFDAKDAMLVALILARQASFGYLKHVTLSLRKDDQTFEDRRLRALLLQVCQAPGLESLILRFNFDDEEVLDVIEAKLPVSASLKRLSCRGTLDPYLDLLLEWHAATLEDVSISSGGPRVTSLLAAMPCLRKLHCPILPGMQVLWRRCPSLTYLKLDLHAGSDEEEESLEAGLPGAGILLRSAAAHLEHLKIIYAPYTSPEVVDLLLNVGRPGSVTALRSLRFMHMRYDPETRRRDSFDEDESESPSPLLVPLTAILPRLPFLTSLDIDGEPSDAFLDALDGQVLRKLERLDIRMPRDCACPHSSLHTEERRMKKVMQRYPLLHVFIQTVDLYYVCTTDCSFCKSHSCHAGMDRDGPWLLLSHRGSGCCVSHVFDPRFPEITAFEVHMDASSG